jgi:hypothetical protein
MRIVLAPFSGETHDRAALADAAHGSQPLPAQTIGLFVRLDPVDAIGVPQGNPGATVEQGTRSATASRNERVALARQISDGAWAPADAAPADRRAGAAMATGHRQEVIGAEDVLRAWRGRRGMPAWSPADRCCLHR